MAQKARLISFVLLLLTLAAGFMFGLAWDARRPAQNGPAEEGAEITAREAATEEPEAPAEEEGGGRQRGSVIYEVMMQPEQRAAVDQIIVHFRSSMDALRETARRDYNQQRTDLLMATRDSIKAVLNPAQIAQYDSLLAVRYPPNRTRREGSGGGPGDERRREGEAR